MSSLYSETANGAFVVSLDFEKMWGVRDLVRPSEDYAKSILGVDDVVPALLKLFQKYEVPATWATVGMLFADSITELKEFWPDIKPAYHNLKLSPYHEAELEGSDERLWLAPDLIKAVSETPSQEIATHTFSHYYCGEEGQTVEQFAADMKAAVTIASHKGYSFTTIIFPRHQSSVGHLSVLSSYGVQQWRAAPGHWVSKSRLARWLNSYFRLAQSQCLAWSRAAPVFGLVDVTASEFLRPYSPKFAGLERRKIGRITEGLRFAAETSSIYHLWWHPHNFSSHLNANLEALEEILIVAKSLQKTSGLQFLSMRQVADKIRSARDSSPSYV